MTVIETARLRLRPFTPDDLDIHHATVYSDPDVMRYMPGGAPRTREMTERVIASFTRHWEKHGYGPWAVTERATGRLIGQCGLNNIPLEEETFDFCYTVAPEKPVQVEVLYALTKDCWGQGYATEGARASLRYGFEKLGLDLIFALAFPKNTGSRRVMEKIGMTYAGTGFYYEVELATYTITRDAFTWDGSPYAIISPH